METLKYRKGASVMDDHAFKVYEGLWDHLNHVIYIALLNEDEQTRESVILKLNNEFRFLEHLYQTPNR